MTTAVQSQGGAALDRPAASGLAEVVDTILDKGLVIDAYVRVSLVGIEVVTIDARIVVAGVDTYLRFAEAVNRLNIADTGGKGLPEFLESAQEGGAEEKVKGGAKGALEAAGETVQGFIDRNDERPRTSPRHDRVREE
jgi:hypothetical protein